jgi:oxalate---CoA ligase
LIAEWIARAAARRGGAPYLEAPYLEAPYLEDGAGTGTLTYAGLRRSTALWADGLDRAGISPGARVAVRLPDPLRYATALVSILGAGRVVIPLDPAAPAAELSRVLAVASPEAAVGDSGSGLPPGLTVLRPPEVPNGPGYRAGAAHLLRSAGPSRAGGIFLCTSGTTGAPKGVLLREDQLGHVAAGVAGHHRLTSADRGYCCLPLFHVNAEVVGLLATLAAGACLVLDRKFSRRGFWELIEEQRITWINAVPAIITVLAMDAATVRPAVRPAGRVRFVRSASAPLPPSVLRRFEEASGIPVIETYGMTEAASMITANPLDGPRKAGSVGLPAGTEVRIAQLDAGRYVPGPALTVGRVQIRGRGVIREYAENGPAGAIDSEGWLDTGDLGHLDHDGYLFLAGRSDDVINRGGEKIYPREIEDVLLAQPGVRSAAVVAAHDDVLGERPVAYVVPAEPWPCELADALREACEAALPRPKRPTAFCLVRELPLGPTGKVARHRLQELAAAHHALPSSALGGGGRGLPFVPGRQPGLVVRGRDVERRLA